MSRGVDKIKLAAEKLFGSVVTQNLTGQAVDTVSEEADFVGRVIGNTLSLGNEPTQHTVVAFVCALLAGRIRMGEVHLQLAVLQLQFYHGFVTMDFLF